MPESSVHTTIPGYPNETISIHRYTLDKNEEPSPEIVRAYKRIFAEPPWEEYKRCPVCTNTVVYSRTMAAATFGKCSCGKELVDFWSDESIGASIRDNLSLNGSCHLLRINGELVGLAFGCEKSAERLETDLLFPGLRDALHTAFGSKCRFAYQDDIIIFSKYRGRGLGKALFQARHADFTQSGLQAGVTRVMSLPPIVIYQWYIKIGYSVIGRYNESPDRGRVILARSFTNLEHLL